MEEDIISFNNYDNLFKNEFYRFVDKKTLEGGEDYINDHKYFNL